MSKVVKPITKRDQILKESFPQNYYLSFSSIKIDLELNLFSRLRMTANANSKKLFRTIFNTNEIRSNYSFTISWSRDGSFQSTVLTQLALASEELP
ncbi:hypothetical protein TNIN_418521 [Trichonephila inaurata madagascariensis]|uniref:Uncharacterized protein n=1 Tax=Trichonephila inaurata madagascariensis TaxID=2747483 RepID=A0A8X6YQF5_9ARAC|nr:hypothetical protein TNIN_418521 [Trichonephila inaurata madagascariensis]